MKQQVTHTFSRINLWTATLIGTLLCFFACSCTRTIYQPVRTEVSETESLREKQAYERLSQITSELTSKSHRTDSVVIRDSVVVVVNESGKEVSRYEFHDRNKEASNSTEILSLRSQIDSLTAMQQELLLAVHSQREQTIVEIERKPSRWEVFTQRIGIGTIVLVSVGTAIYLLWVLFRKKLF